MRRPRPAVAGAVLHGPLAAQVRDTIPPPGARDTTLTVAAAGARRLARCATARQDGDSLKRAPRGDASATPIKAPLAHAELPLELGIGRRLHWSRDSLFATGALTVADLLERVPGIIDVARRLDRRAANVARTWATCAACACSMMARDYEPLDPRGAGRARSHADQSVGDRGRDRSSRGRTKCASICAAGACATPRRTRAPTSAPAISRRISIAASSAGASTMASACSSARSSTERRRRRSLGTSSDQLGDRRARWVGEQELERRRALHRRISRHRGAIFGDSTGFPATAFPPTRRRAPTRTCASASAIRTRAPSGGRRWPSRRATTTPAFARSSSPTRRRPRTPRFNSTSLDTNTFRSQYIVTGGTVRGPLRLSATERLFGARRQASVHAVVRAQLRARPSWRSRRSPKAKSVGLDRAQRRHGAVLAAVVRQPARRRRPLVGQPREGQQLHARTTCAPRPGCAFAICGSSAACCAATAFASSPPHVFDTHVRRRARADGDRRRRRRFAASSGACSPPTCRRALERLVRLLSAAVPDAQRAVRPTNLLSRFPTGDFGLLGVDRARIPLRRALSRSATTA